MHALSIVSFQGIFSSVRMTYFMPFDQRTMSDQRFVMAVSSSIYRPPVARTPAPPKSLATSSHDLRMWMKCPAYTPANPLQLTSKTEPFSAQFRSHREAPG
ncbi:hypothetical protein MHYP_G00304750 [Metynnis hypsauchen]